MIVVCLQEMMKVSPVIAGLFRGTKKTADIAKCSRLLWP